MIKIEVVNEDDDEIGIISKEYSCNVLIIEGSFFHD